MRFNLWLWIVTMGWRRFKCLMRNRLKINRNRRELLSPIKKLWKLLRIILIRNLNLKARKIRASATILKLWEMWWLVLRLPTTKLTTIWICTKSKEDYQKATSKKSQEQRKIQLKDKWLSCSCREFWEAGHSKISCTRGKKKDWP